MNWLLIIAGCMGLLGVAEFRIAYTRGRARTIESGGDLERFEAKMHGRAMRLSQGAVFVGSLIILVVGLTGG